MCLRLRASHHSSVRSLHDVHGKDLLSHTRPSLAAAPHMATNYAGRRGRSRVID
jgi:hypothetical protein